MAKKKIPGLKYGTKEIIINDSNYKQFAVDVDVGGEKKARGCVPRDWDIQPFGSLMYAKPFDMPLIPESEWQSRLDDQIANKSQLSDIRDISGPNGGPIPSRDQNGKGYCWAHSPTS